MLKLSNILLIIVIHITGYSQVDSVKKEWIIKGGIKDQAKLWTSPLKIKPKHTFVLIPLATITASAIYFDEHTYSIIDTYRTKHPWIISTSEKLTYAGDGLTALGISSLFYLTGHLTKNEKALQTGALCMQALIHSGIITGIGKMAFSRKRPSSGYGVDWQPDGVSVWHFFPAYLKSFQGEPQSNYSSFPSGHTSTAWSIATVIAKQYQSTLWVPIIAYSTATAVGITRMILDKHWSSDVIVGAAIGYGVGHYLFKNRNNTHWTLLPSGSTKNISLTGIYTFN